MKRLALSLLLVVGCATQSKRAATLNAAEATLNVARDGFLAYDRQHQLDLVAGAATRAEASDALVKYEASRDCETCPGALLLDAYRAIEAAVAVNDDPSLATALAAVAQLQAALHTLTGGKL